MSTFKRHQSKVFWSQMEQHDSIGAAMSSYSAPATPHRSPQPQPRPRAAPRARPLPLPASRAHEAAFSLSNEDEDEDEDEDVINTTDSDATDPENTTVIHIEMRDSPARSSSERQAAESVVPAEILPSPAAVAAVVINNNNLEERSFSPASRGQRSQDSGFSDSDRSDNSSADLSPESPARRRRRRRGGSGRGSSRRHRPQLNGDQAGPAHTSTPKRELPKGGRTSRQPVPAPRQLDYSIDETAEPETLDDFLYSSEPPLNEGDEEQQPCFADYSQILRPSGLDPRAPVRVWLDELRLEVEEECMATLQSKSLPRRKLRDDEPESRDLRLLTASATTAAKKVIDTAGRFDERYKRALDLIVKSKNGKVDRDLVESIEAEATEILLKLGSSLPRSRVVQRKHQADENPRDVAMRLTRLKHSVDRALDNRLDFYIEKVVRGLEEAPREGGSTARGALAALTALGLAGPRAGASVARCSGIRALLTSLVSSARLTSELRSASLRALASVCCCIEAVDQFVAEGGPEILADVLAPGTATPQTERSEAAALLVQVTAPWMDHVGLPYVEPYARQFVGALTELAETTSCKQTLLLAAAGINHLARSRRCIAAIVECDSIKKLLRCVKKSNDGNVWLMEQVASLVGQVARVPQARAHLAESKASVALVIFLRMQPPGLEDEYRRLAATTSEALTRLCVDPEIAKQVVAVGGSDCLPPGSASPDGPGAASANAAEANANCNNRRDRDEGARFHTTKSLRVARRIAAEQIGIARIHDCSPH